MGGRGLGQAAGTVQTLPAIPSLGCALLSPGKLLLYSPSHMASVKYSTTSGENKLPPLLGYVCGPWLPRQFHMPLPLSFQPEKKALMVVSSGPRSGANWKDRFQDPRAWEEAAVCPVRVMRAEWTKKGGACSCGRPPQIRRAMVNMLTIW